MQFSYVSPFNTENTKYTGPLAIVKYDGEKVDDKMNGYGKILFANTSTYEGFLNMDKLHGKGKMIDPVNKTVYEGDFVDDKREGNGKFIYEGGYYEGGYHNNKQNGEGKQAIGPHLLIGFFVDGVCKSGRLSYECGDIYIGEFNEDLDKHGNGKFFDADDGSIRAGLWENDVFISK